MIVRPEVFGDDLSKASFFLPTLLWKFKMGAGEWKVANYVVIHESESENNFYIISLCIQYSSA